MVEARVRVVGEREDADWREPAREDGPGRLALLGLDALEA
jgi:hypothetical protein